MEPEDDIQLGEGDGESPDQLVPDSSSDTSHLDAEADSDLTVPTVEDGAAPKLTGGIPEDRHKAILETTRTQYEERLAKVAWAAAHDRAQVERAMQIADLYDKDPSRLHEYLSKHIKQPPASVTPDFQTEDGTPLFSADRVSQLIEQKATAIAEARVAALEARLAPIESSAQESAQVASLTAQIENASRWPWFTDNAEAITEILRQCNERNLACSLEQAYIHVVAPKLAASKETLSAEAKKAVLAEMNNTTERAQDDLDPKRSPASSRKRNEDKGWSELFEEEMKAARSA